MDLGSLFMFCFISLVIGAVLMLIVQYYIYMRFCNLPTVTTEQKFLNAKYTLPQDIRANSAKFDPESKSPLMALNLIMQFLFHELKHTTRVRKWFYRKLTLELDELVKKTTTGKLFDKLTLRDLYLGDNFPEIKVLRVHDVEISESEGRINNLDLLLEIKYDGNFKIAIDADMVLGKKAWVMLKVKHVAGLARLQFTRIPYSHWSLSFLGDPDMDLGIESKFQGRQMQSNISALISNQIRRAVRRKHTLPKYKIRYKPFFHKVEEEHDTDIPLHGKLTIKISEISRLRLADVSVNEFFCALTLSSIPWVEVKQKDFTNLCVLIDIEVHKAKNQQMGILFKQGEKAVEIEAILPNTPAIKSHLKAGDILISIDGSRTTSINQVAKIVKGLHKTVIVLRIERVIPGVIHNEASLDDMSLYDELVPQRSKTSLCSIDLASGSLAPSNASRQGRNNSSGDSSVSSTPSQSPRRATKFVSKSMQKSISPDSSDSSVSRYKIPDDAISMTSSMAPSDLSATIPTYQHHTTDIFPIDQLIHIDDRCKFELDAKTKYLNVCVYGRSAEEHMLLAFLNISMKNVIAECSETTLIETTKLYSLNPPTTPNIKSYISSLSGFNPKLCFGDIIMEFMWDGNPAQYEASLMSKRSSKTNLKEGEADNKSEGSAPKTHHFIRTHFHRATQCDFCGKKIWLKDAVQCRNCLMTCHKKCVAKCQNSTVCGPVDLSSDMISMTTLQPEFTLTAAPPILHRARDQRDQEQDEQGTQRSAVDSTHRQSLTGLIAQGIKRVNSANNLSVPGGSPSSNQNSRSLPPSPQHTPRKQSLANQGTSPFLAVTQILESIPSDASQLTNEHIESITEPIISLGRDRDVMSMAKEASKDLFNDISGTERVNRINALLTKLRLALDIETANHSRLLESNPNENSILRSASVDNPGPPHPTSTDQSPQADPNSEGYREFMARRSHELSRSDEKVQALSVIMLYLCTGLQHAQGVASH